MRLKHSYGLVLLLVFCFGGAFAGDTLTIKEALQKKMISISIHGASKDRKSSLNHGYYGPCLELEVKNLTDSTLNLKLETGTILGCENKSTQNMMVTKELAFTLPGKESDTYPTYAMCVQQHNSTPHRRSVYHIAGMADNKLLSFAKIIEKFNFQDAAGQSAVWVFSDNSDTSSVAGASYDEIRKLKKYINRIKYNDYTKVVEPGDFKGEPKLLPDMPPTITVNLIWSMKKNGHASLQVYDSENKLIETVFDKRSFSRGEQSYYLIFSSEKLVESGKYFVRLKIRNKIVEELSSIAE